MREKNEWMIYSDKNCEDAANFFCGKPRRAVKTSGELEVIEETAASALITAQMTGNYRRENVLSCENGWTPTGTGEGIRNRLHFCYKICMRRLNKP